MTDREPMTPEELVTRFMTFGKFTYGEAEAAAAHLRRLAALERDEPDIRFYLRSAREAHEKAEALEAENARLRAVLEAYARHSPLPDPAIAALAREALEGPAA